MSVSVDDLNALAGRARAQAEAAGELHPTGPVSADLTEAARRAIGDALRSGAYEQAARDAIAGDPEMTQL